MGHAGAALCVKLNSGYDIPLVGLGTWKAEAGLVGKTVKEAVKCGYRMIDCANDYGNEKEIGNAIRELIQDGSVKREDLFIQAKLWNSNHRKEHVRLDLLSTLDDLQLSYIDSFIIHWPQAVPSNKQLAVFKHGNHPAPASEGTMFPLEQDGRYCADMDSHYIETWHAMEELVDEGLVKSIGVSNFNRTQLLEVYQSAKKYKPAILQNECHPFLQLKDLLDICRHLNVHVQAYSPLGSFDRPWIRSPNEPELLHDHRLVEISKSHGRTTAQIVLRWQTQRGVSVVPKTVHVERARENISIFDFVLSEAEMQSIGGLNIGWRYLLWKETSMHPDYPFKEEIPYGYSAGPAPLNTSTSA